MHSPGANAVRPRAATAALMLAVVVSACPSRSFAVSTGPQPSVTGAPAIGSEAAEGLCIQCHNSFPANPDTNATLTLDGVPAKYEPGKTYTLTMKIADSDTTLLRWGFQLTAIAMKDGAGAGEFNAIDPSRTMIVMSMTGTRSHIEHSYGGTGIGQSGGTSWTFEWKAPAAPVGEIGFFAAANAANADGSNQGDRIYTKSPAPLARSAPP